MTFAKVIPVFLVVAISAAAIAASDSNSENSAGNSTSAVDSVVRQQVAELIAVLNSGSNYTTPEDVLQIAEDYIVSNVSNSLRREISDELNEANNGGEDIAPLSEGLKERIRWQIVGLAVRSLPQELQPELTALRDGYLAADRVSGDNGQPIIREYKRRGFWRRLGRGLVNVGGRILTSVAANAILRG